jgi:ribonuclease HI
MLQMDRTLFTNDLQLLRPKLIGLVNVPKNSTVNIYTDSQNCMHNWTFFHDPLTSRRKQVNRNNHQIWTFMKSLSETKNLHVILHKIKSHSNDVYNDIADKLAKQGLDSDPIIIRPNAYMSSLLSVMSNMGSNRSH